jgi:hypothetical protein
MVEVFRTNIDSEVMAGILVDELQQTFPLALVNFDLEDCDRILRIKGEDIHPPRIITLVQRKGFICEVLE